jgi:putative oxidoreductase
MISAIVRPKRIWLLLARTALGMIFLYAGILKTFSTQEFAEQIAKYQLVPDAAVNLMAMGLPAFEIVCGLMVITGIFQSAGSLSMVLLLITFLGATTFGLVRGLSIDCGCFGNHSWLDASPLIALLRDTALLVLAGCVYWESGIGHMQKKSLGVVPHPTEKNSASAYHNPG